MLIEVRAHKPGKQACRLCHQCREDWRKIFQQEKCKGGVCDVKPNPNEARKRKQGNQLDASSCKRSSVEDNSVEMNDENQFDFFDDGDLSESTPVATDSISQALIPGPSQPFYLSQTAYQSDMMDPSQAVYQTASQMSLPPTSTNQLEHAFYPSSQQPGEDQNHGLGFSFPNYNTNNNQASFPEMAHDQPTANYGSMLDNPSQQSGYAESPSEWMAVPQGTDIFRLNNQTFPDNSGQPMTINPVKLSQEYQPFPEGNSDYGGERKSSVFSEHICTDSHSDHDTDLNAILGLPSSPDSGLGCTNSPEEEIVKELEIKENEDYDENLKLDFEEDFDFDVDELLKLDGMEKTFDYVFGTSGLDVLETDGAIKSALPRTTPQDSTPSILVIPEVQVLPRRPKEKDNTHNEVVNVVVIVGCIVLAIFVRFYFS